MYTKVLEMCELTKAGLIGSLLATLLATAGGAATAITFSANGTPCTGSLTMTAPGTVSCGSTTLLPGCAGQQTVVIDAQGKINCVTSAPTAPTNVTATGGNTQATVVFTAPTSTGGAAITGYTVTSSPSGGTDSNAGSTALSHIVTGLTNGASYTFTVTATNSAGTSAASTSSNSVTPSASKISQTISFGTKPTITVNGTGTVSATGGASGNPVTFTSTTTGICTISGSTVTGIAAGNCIIAANQAGNASYNAATQVTQTITIGSTSIPVSTTPSCTLAQSFIAVPAGQIRLVVNCAPEATSYEWSANAGFVGTATGGLLTAPTASTTYTVTGINAAGRGNLATLLITVTPLTPICTIAPAASVIDLGGTSTMTASCNPAADSYTWTGGTCAGNSTNTCTVTPTAIGKTTYTVAGTNSVGLGIAASATVEVATPTCTLTAAPLSVVPGESSTLTATCSPAATGGYTWTGGTCAGNTTNTCTVTLAALGAATYTVQGANAAGQGTAASATVTVVPLTTPSCTLTNSAPSVTPGGSSTLTASCSPTATGGYTWTGGACAGITTNTCNTGALTAVGSTTYTVQGINSAGTGSAASATVTVATDPGCPNGYTYSTVVISWPAHVSITGPLQTMNHCEVKAYQFTMPARESVISETVYASVPKYLTLSQTPYDFSPALEAAGCAARGSNNPLIWQSTTGWVGNCPVVQGATYYLNVRNASSYNGADNCPAGSKCTFYLSW